MSILNRVEIKLSELNNPILCGVEIGKSISLRERNDKWYIFGRIYPNKSDKTKFENIQKSTDKSSTKQNYNYLMNNLQQTLWDLSNTKKEMEKKILDENQSNQLPYFGDVSKSVLDDKIKNKEIEIETYKDYIRKYNKYIHPFFKDYKINKITQSVIKKFQIWLIDECKIKSIKNIRGVLSVIIKSFISDGLINTNPIDKVKLPKKDRFNIIEFNDNKDIKSFNSDEMNMIFNHLDTFISKSKRKYSTICRTQLKGIIYLMFGSGIRSGELICLQWKDIDFLNKEIKIYKSVRDGRIKSTKTEYSDRKIDITKESLIGLNILKDLKDNINKDDFIIKTQYDEMYVDTKSIDTLWKKLLDECKIEKRNFYNLRHTFATTMIQNGLDIVSVSKILGHRDITTTIQRYIDGSNSVKSIMDISVRNHNF